MTSINRIDTDSTDYLNTNLRLSKNSKKPFLSAQSFSDFIDTNSLNHISIKQDMTEKPDEDIKSKILSNNSINNIDTQHKGINQRNKLQTDITDDIVINLKKTIEDRSKIIEDLIRQTNNLSFKIKELQELKKTFDETHSQLLDYVNNRKMEVKNDSEKLNTLINKQVQPTLSTIKNIQAPIQIVQQTLRDMNTYMQLEQQHIQIEQSVVQNIPVPISAPVQNSISLKLLIGNRRHRF